MSLNAIEDWVGKALPEPYHTFLADTEESELIGELTFLYGRADFVERNETYETKEYCPGYVTIGDNCGGGQVILCLQTGAIAIVDAGDMTPESARPLAGGFAEWVEAGCPV